MISESVSGEPGPCDVVIRHPKEKKSKCSLQPLVEREDIIFHEARSGFKFDATGYILLQIDAPVLSEADARLPLLLLDSTWRLLPQLEAILTGIPTPRSLPPWLKTAYPRVSKISQDPARGLASIEALYTARLLAGRPVDGLLDHYYWKDSFLQQFEKM
jgi:pre-rRNA-processing protein TSR3